ncbi:hypothetical protein [Methylobacterium sp. JK268]
MFESALTAAEVRRRARATLVERSVFGLILGLGAVTSGFAAYTMVETPRAFSGRTIVPAAAATTTWKRGVAAAETPPVDLDPLITGSLPDSVPVPPSRGGAGDPSGRGYTLRGVVDGAAVVEGPSGLRQVAPGADLPGAGRVLSILPSGGSWIVVTSETIIAGNGPMVAR